MDISRYYEAWYLQELIERPTGLPPPWDTEKVYGDSTRIEGRFLLTQSTEQLIAAAQDIATRGRFACHPSEDLVNGYILRRESDSTFIRLVSDPLVAPTQAVSQIKTYEAVVADRASIELAAQSAPHFSGRYGS